MYRFKLFLLIFSGFLLSTLQLSASTQIAPDERITSRTVWTTSGSPYHLAGDLIIEKEGTLIIDPGVEVRLDTGVSIIVHGTLQARGERGMMVRFLPEESESRWGHILFDGDEGGQPAYDEQLRYSGGSILEYTLFEGGGNVPETDYNGGTVACIQDSPVIQDCRFIGNSAPRGGAILCHRFANPLIRRNTISENEATFDDGGAIYIFLYAHPIIVDNYFLRNRAQRSGGAIYISAADADLRHNILINNSAGEYGGALYLSSTNATVEENAFLHNSGWRGSGTIYLVADVKPVIRQNSLDGTGYLVYIDNVTNSIDLSENWWQTVNEVEVELKLLTQFTTKPAVEVNYQPLLSHPPESLPTQPVELNSLRVMTDRTWSEELHYDLSHDAQVLVQVEARDRNPWSRDQTSARLFVLGRPLQTIELILFETGDSSGVFRGEAWVKQSTNPLDREIGAVIGDTVIVESTVDPLFHTQYRVSESVPYVSNFEITSEIDITHVVDPTIELRWNYFDLRQRPQREIQLQIASNPGFAPADILDTDLFAHTGLQWEYDGARLQDGEMYYLRIRAGNGDGVSPWTTAVIRNDNGDYSFRMNSLPATPEPVEPLGEQPVRQRAPILRCQPAVDKEGDRLTYQFELFESEYRRELIVSSSTHNPVFMLTDELPDNVTRCWRARIYDGYEHTPWSEPVSFPVNYLEEPPAAPGILDPFGDIVTLTPSFEWLEASDPDPMSQVNYYLQLSTTGSFSGAEKIETGSETSVQLTEPLANDVDYFWRVTAVDRTDLQTHSKIGKFRADTRPSVPLLRFPTARRELGTGVTFQAVASVDPDPEDLLTYDLQLALDPGFRNPVAYERDLQLEDLNQLTASDLSSGSRLADDLVYYCRLRARDDQGITSAWSNPEEFILNLVNDPPDLPAVITPAQQSVIHSTTPLLEWQPLTDPDLSDDAENLQLLLEFNRDPAFDEQLTRTFLTDPGLAHYTLPDPLQDNSHWFLRWRAVDDGGARSPVSEPVEFTVNVVEEPPGDFRLQEPAPGSTRVKLTEVLFSWEEAVDNDPDAEVMYHIQVAADPQFEELLFDQADWQETSLELAGPLPNAATTHWRVTATDNGGLQTVAEGGSFYTDTTPATPQPYHTDLLQAGDLLSWTTSEDPDPEDHISYTVRFREQGSSRIAFALSGINQTQLAAEELAQLEDNRDWEFSVTAVDNHGISSAPSPFDRFHLNLVKEPPATVDPGSSGDDPTTHRSNQLTLQWRGMSDPDRADSTSTLSARLQLDLTPEFNSPALNLVAVPAGNSSVLLQGLRDNSCWYYRIRVIDGDGLVSEWSRSRSFVVNKADEPPQPVRVLRPETGATLAELNGLELHFTEPVDPDWGDAVESVVEIAGDQSFGTPLLQQKCPETSTRLRLQLNSGDEYYLRVVCTDRSGLTSRSEVIRFQVDSHPSTPKLLNAEPAAAVPADADLEWHAATDPDPADRVTYQLEVGRNRMFDDPHITRNGLMGTAVSLTGMGLEANVEYFWHVRAVDDNGLHSDFSATGRFVIQ